MKQRIVLVIVAAVLALGMPGGTASAHASLVAAEPAAGASLAAAPRELKLTFSEPLDPGFTRVQLLDSQRKVINAGPGSIDPSDQHRLLLPIGEVPQGSYTALWRVRSAVDGHITEGNIPFGVGVAVTTSGLIPPIGAPDPATELPPALDSLARWFSLLAAALAFGALPFALFVWRPALRRASGPELANTDQQMTSALRRLLIGGGSALIVASLLYLLSQAATAAGVSFMQALGAPLVQLLGSRTGQLGLVRIGLAAGVMLLAWKLPPAALGSAWPWWLALALAGGAILTFSLGGHGAALADNAALAIAVDWLHIAATVAWIGGLAPLAIAIWMAGSRAGTDDGRRPIAVSSQQSAGGGQQPASSHSPSSFVGGRSAVSLAAIIPRFSILAISSVIVLALSGLYNYTRHIGALELLPATTYGRALLVKSALFGLLLLFGALNLLVLSPRLRAVGNRLAASFRETVRAELVVGALVLLAVGAMTAVAPSISAWQAKERQGVASSATVGDVNMVLRMAPALIGDNEFAVDVTDNRPGAQQAASKVLLRFNMAGMQMGQLQTEAQTSDTLRYTTRGNFVSMGGRWMIEVILRRAGFDDVRHTFEMDVVRSALAQ